MMRQTCAFIVRLHRIVAVANKPLDKQMLLDPLEE